MAKYILTEEEYNVLDKAFDKAGLYNDGQFIYQYKGADYYACCDEEYVEDFDYKAITDEDEDDIYIVPILEYMSEIDECLCDFVSVYKFTETDIEIYDGLCKKANCFSETCKER